MESSNNKNYKNLKDFNSSNELIEKLKDIVPIAFKDGVLDFDQLKLELGLIDWNSEERNEKYGLNWVGKNKAYFETTKTSTMTLVPQRDKSMNFDESDNIIIEGDNLEVLRLLEKSYFKKVDVIYIDPPYNTGNDFVYNDNFRQDKKEFDQQNNIKNDEGYNVETKNTKSDGRFHTNWLNMMYPRLRLARELLKDDGVIFISIDDNEQARLKLMCDEIFGEQNFVGCLVVENNPKGRKNNNFISYTHEYCLVYSKNKEMSYFVDIVPKHSNDMELDENGNYVRKSGKRILVGENQLNKFVNNKLSNKHYSTYIKNNEILIRKEEEIHNVDNDLVKNGFKRYISYFNNKFVENTYTSQKLIELFYEGALDIRNDKIYEKHFSNMMQLKSCLKNQEYEAIINNKKINYILDLKTTRAKEQFFSLFKKSEMNNEEIFPKNLNFIKTLVSLIENKNSLILDFFAGSGTTGQAVMELNKEDGGNRKFILVQYPEKSENLENTEFETIADITRERIKRSIKMYDYNENGFKAFKLQDSNLKAFDVNLNDSVDVIQQKLFDYANKIKEGATTEDLIYEIILRVGKLPLDIKIESETIANNKVYFDENKYFIFILEPTIGSKYYENIFDVIKQVYQDTPIHVFLNDSYFKNDQDKINFNESIKNIEKKEAKIEVVVI